MTKKQDSTKTTMTAIVRAIKDEVAKQIEGGSLGRTLTGNPAWNERIEQELLRHMSKAQLEELSKRLDESYLNGSGAVPPKGIFNDH